VNAARLAAALAAFATVACASGAFSQAPDASAAADSAAVTRLEQRWLAAVSPGGDRGKLEGILADDYIDTDWQGRIRDKADLLHGATPEGVTEHVTDMRVRVWGDTAVATGINHVHSGAKVRSVDVAFTDVFSRIDGRWRAISSQETLRKPAPSAH
jgi:hypothetical protein